MSEPVKQGGGKTIDDSLVMKSGSVIDLVGQSEWPSLAQTMQNIYLPIQQKLSTDEQASYVVHLCTVYYAYQRQRVIWTGKDPDADVYKMKKTDLDDLIDFLEKFMERNRQWDYIKKQEWYISRKYAIGIDVNYYPDRSGFTTFIAFHKDTGGNNIFVNLVFDNKMKIEATEWYKDAAEPSGLRKQWQEKLLPATYLTELASTRAELRKDLVGKPREVAGGVSPHLYTYVSWLDDLIWHSTPNGNARTEYGAADAARGYDALNATVKGDFAYFDDTLKVTVLGWEILATMAESTDTQLYRWLKKQGSEMQDLGFEKSRQAWLELYGDALGGARAKTCFLEDAKSRSLLPWRITGQYSEANAEDDRLAQSKSIDEPPVLLSRLRRANSFSDVQSDLDKVREANKGKPRAFIRTWVRILPIGHQELIDSEVTFQQLG